MNTLHRHAAWAKLDSTTTAVLAPDRSSGVRRRISSQLPGGLRFQNDRYELLEVIAVGGTSVVHEVYDHLLYRKLAGKFMLLDEGENVAMAAQLEARATARLSHPNIVTIHDVGTCGSTTFLLMELLEGGTLAEELACHRLAPRRAIAVILSVAAALEHAHQQGILHLDLKPGNVHVGHDGVIKLLDFGVGSRYLTAVGSDEEPTVVGTPYYMAPEQWNFGWLDARTDVWSLGLLLYECLSGHLPCEGRHPGFASASGQGFSVPPISSKLGLPNTIDGVIQRALAADPARRFQSIREFAATLSAVQRVLLDNEVQALSSAERRLAGAADVVEGDFKADELHELTKLPRAMAAKELAQLVRRGVLSAQHRALQVRYCVNDRALSQACFQALPSRERAQLLESSLLKESC